MVIDYLKIVAEAEMKHEDLLADAEQERRLRALERARARWWRRRWPKRSARAKRFGFPIRMVRDHRRKACMTYSLSTSASEDAT